MENKNKCPVMIKKAYDLLNKPKSSIFLKPKNKFDNRAKVAPIKKKE